MISKYTSLLQNKDEVIELLSENFEDHGRYRETKNPIAITWIISFDQIRTQDPLAARILSFISCILRENIPASLLPQGNSGVEQTKAIGTLTAYAFITKREHQQQKHESYDTYRLVHLATQNWLKMNQQWTVQVREAFAQLLDTMPFGDYRTRESWKPYLPHVLCVVARAGKVEIGKLGELLDRIGSCQQVLGHYAASEESTRKALKMIEKKNGKEHPRTLQVMLNVAAALHGQGKYVEAEHIHREVTAIREKVLGRQHIDTLKSMEKIGDSLKYQRKYAEAEQVHREVLVLREKELGKYHYDTLQGMTGLAKALARQKKYAEAEKLHREVLAHGKKILGEMNSQTLLSMNDLAIVLRRQEKYIEAEEVGWNSLALHEDLLGKEHPETLTCMRNQAIMFWVQGNFVKSEEMERKTVARSKDRFGRENPQTLMYMYDIARSLEA